MGTLPTAHLGGHVIDVRRDYIRLSAKNVGVIRTHAIQTLQRPYLLLSDSARIIIEQIAHGMVGAWLAQHRANNMNVRIIKEPIVVELSVRSQRMLLSVVLLNRGFRAAIGQR